MCEINEYVSSLEKALRFIILKSAKAFLYKRTETLGGDEIYEVLSVMLNG